LWMGLPTKRYRCAAFAWERATKCELPATTRYRWSAVVEAGTNPYRHPRPILRDHLVPRTICLGAHMERSICSASARSVRSFAAADPSDRTYPASLWDGLFEKFRMTRLLNRFAGLHTLIVISERTMHV
jgi:hypothetical protein